MNLDLKCPDRFDIVEEMRQRIAEITAERDEARNLVRVAVAVKVFDLERAKTLVAQWGNEP